MSARKVRPTLTGSSAEADWTAKTREPNDKVARTRLRMNIIAISVGAMGGRNLGFIAVAEVDNQNAQK